MSETPFFVKQQLVPFTRKALFSAEVKLPFHNHSSCAPGNISTTGTSTNYIHQRIPILQTVWRVSSHRLTL